jgi:D-alanine-D-alanine ligase
MTKRIALLYGGASGEHDVSVMGYEYVSSLLRNTKYEIIPIYIGKNGEWSYRLADSDVKVYPVAENGGGLHTERGFIKIDAAIPLLHGDGGEDGTVQGALECAGIKYVGADVVTSAVCLDKTYTKALAVSLGIPVIDGVSFTRREDTRSALARCERLGFPMFIKPSRLGSSIGAYPVFTKEDFLARFPDASNDGDGLVCVEKYVGSKRELECAFFEMDGKRTVTPPGEILTDGFYGYGEKYGGKVNTAAVAQLDAVTVSEIIGYAKTLADAVNLRHLGRIDFFLSDGKIYFNEINTFPGFTAESLYPKMLEAYGVDPGRAMESFIEDALCS